MNRFFPLVITVSWMFFGAWMILASETYTEAGLWFLGAMFGMAIYLKDVE